MADFLIALSDFDRRRGWEALGHASLFAFVRAELGLSRSGAYWRLSAARLVQRFPQVIEPLRDGRLCMSTTAELAKVLTEENRDEVLPRYFGLSAREAQEVTAELAPRQELPVRDLVTRVERDGRLRLVEPTGPAPEGSPMATPATTATQAAAATPTGESVQTSGLRPAQPPRYSAPPTCDDVEPLTADLRRLHITVSREFLRDLEQARDGLSHAIPGATTEQVLQLALRLLLEKQARARGQVKRPRAERVAPAAPELRLRPWPPSRSRPRRSRTSRSQLHREQALARSSPPPCAVPSGSATRGAAPGRSTPEAAVVPRTSWSSTRSSRGPGTASPRWRIFA